MTEHNVVTQTTTDYSVQTLLNFVPASEPFYPLAPTLHRSAQNTPIKSVLTEFLQSGEDCPLREPRG